LPKLHLTAQKKCASLNGRKNLKIAKKQLKEEIACGMCSKTFASKSLLKHHIRTHSNVNMKKETVKGKVVCETCGKMFPSQTLFKASCCGPQ
jgi:transcription elongation factor Elf1